MKLQLWLTESGIQSFQSHGTPTPDEYIHNHILRDAVNGTWGETVEIKQGETKQVEDSYSLKGKTWKPENMSVVGFIYDAQTMEVFYVTEIPLISQNID
ncbi:MAG: Omp28-related outer membrane protein [Tannerella sp.]|nr:Omp28-related outer membrane protein [Tannerella sp.]